MSPCVQPVAGWPSSQLLAVRLEAHVVRLLLYSALSTLSPRARLRRGGTSSMPPCVMHAAG